MPKANLQSLGEYKGAQLYAFLLNGERKVGALCKIFHDQSLIIIYDSGKMIIGIDSNDEIKFNETFDRIKKVLQEAAK